MEFYIERILLLTLDRFITVWSVRIMKREKFIGSENYFLILN